MRCTGLCVAGLLLLLSLLSKPAASEAHECPPLLSDYQVQQETRNKIMAAAVIGYSMSFLGLTAVIASIPVQTLEAPIGAMVAGVGGALHVSGVILLQSSYHASLKALGRSRLNGFNLLGWVLVGLSAGSVPALVILTHHMPAGTVPAIAGYGAILLSSVVSRIAGGIALGRMSKARVSNTDRKRVIAVPYFQPYPGGAGAGLSVVF